MSASDEIDLYQLLANRQKSVSFARAATGTWPRTRRMGPAETTSGLASIEPDPNRSSPAKIAQSPSLWAGMATTRISRNSPEPSSVGALRSTSRTSVKVTWPERGSIDVEGLGCLPADSRAMIGKLRRLSESSSCSMTFLVKIGCALKALKVPGRWMSLASSRFDHRTVTVENLAHHAMVMSVR